MVCSFAFLLQQEEEEEEQQTILLVSLSACIGCAGFACPLPPSGGLIERLASYSTKLRTNHAVFSSMIFISSLERGFAC